MRQSDLQVCKVQCDCGNTAEAFECDLVISPAAEGATVATT